MGKQMLPRRPPRRRGDHVRGGAEAASGAQRPPSTSTPTRPAATTSPPARSRCSSTPPTSRRAEWERWQLQRHPLPRARARAVPDRVPGRPHEPDHASHRQDGGLDPGPPSRRPRVAARDAGRSLFGPIAREVTVLAKSLHRAEAAAEEEATLRLIGETLWTEERLKQFAKMRLGERPWSWSPTASRSPRLEGRPDRQGDPGERPRHRDGSGDARLRRRLGGPGQRRRRPRDRRRAGPPPCPPRRPAYTLRRVWLTPEEEAGYYYGFSNEGLWPLCHIVHTRPRSARRTGSTTGRSTRSSPPLLEEIADTESPMVLIQDYHFALLPALIKRGARTPARRSSGTSRGRTSRPSASARGRTSCSSACSAPT